MGKFIDLIGKRFGRLIVINRVDNSKDGKVRWLCECNCKQKNKIIVGTSTLKNKHTKSCGCIRREKIIIRNKLRTKHGHNKKEKVTVIYKSWDSMIQRCTNPNNENYKDYGGREITVCKRWMKFENFLEDMGEHPGLGYSLHRINNDKGYYKENCKWATIKEQNINKRNSCLITHDGETKCLVVWAKQYNIHYNVLWKRLYIYGWSIEKALTTPVGKWKKK